MVNQYVSWAQDKIINVICTCSVFTQRKENFHDLVYSPHQEILFPITYILVILIHSKNKDGQINY